MKKFKFDFNFKSVLQENPKLLSKYVSVCMGLLNKAVVPLNKAMLHLIDVQNLDPNADPEANFRQQLVDAVNFHERGKYSFFAPTIKNSFGDFASFRRSDKPFRSMFKTGKNETIVVPQKTFPKVEDAPLKVTVSLEQETKDFTLLSKLADKIRSTSTVQPTLEDAAVPKVQDVLHSLAAEDAAPPPKKKASKKKAAKPAKVTVVKNASKSRSPKKANKS